MQNLDKDQKNIISLYGLFFAGGIMMMVPYGIIPFAGLACALVIFCAAYFYRWRKKENETYRVHMTNIIRTTWWSQLILLIGIILFGTIIFNNGDMTAINAMMAMAENGVVPNQQDIAKMNFQFVQDNKKLITITAIFCLSPYPLFLLYRIIKGVRVLTKKEG